jgi:hypothetical protein
VSRCSSCLAPHALALLSRRQTRGRERHGLRDGSPVDSGVTVGVAISALLRCLFAAQPGRECSSGCASKGAGLVMPWKFDYIPYSGIWNVVMELKPQDLLVLFKQVAQSGRAWTYAALGDALGMSASQVHRSVQRCVTAGLAVSTGRGDWRGMREALLEFSVHGVRYAFPAKLGPARRGVPTSFGALPLSADISSAPGEAPVWPYPEGRVRGPSLSPLHRHVPEAALADPALYQYLALLDALRIGRSRERALAEKLLSERLRKPDAT